MSTKETRHEDGVPFLVLACMGVILCSLFYLLLFQDAFFTRGYCYFNEGIGVAINPQGELFVDKAVSHRSIFVGFLHFLSEIAWLWGLFPLAAAYWFFCKLRPMFTLKGYGWDWICLIGTVVVVVMLFNMPEKPPVSGISHLETERMLITPNDIPSQHEREVT